MDEVHSVQSFLSQNYTRLLAVLHSKIVSPSCRGLQAFLLAATFCCDKKNHEHLAGGYDIYSCIGRSGRCLRKHACAAGAFVAQISYVCLLVVVVATHQLNSLLYCTYICLCGARDTVSMFKQTQRILHI